MKYINLLTVTTIFLSAAPSVIASQKITEIELKSNKKSLVLRLEGDKNNELPSFITVDKGNTLEATILNTELDLDREQFQKTNPASGIEKITLDRIDEEHTKITLVKESELTLASNIQQQDSELIVSFEPETTDTSLINKLPFSSEIKSLKNQVASLVTNKNKNDDEKEETKVSDNNQNNDVLVPNPEIIISNPSEGFNDTQENSYEQPYLPRAVAPPVGDMAVSNINASPDTVDLESSAIVPRLVLRDASVREVLSLLARQAGLNIVFTLGQGGAEDSEEGSEEGDNFAEGPTVSLDLENQTVQEAFDSILLISGLSASRRGNTIYIGRNLPTQARNLISRTIRLNQASVEEVAFFLSNLGAEYAGYTQPEVTTKYSSFEGFINNSSSSEEELQVVEGSAFESRVETEEEELIVNTYFEGLAVAVDTRLNALTLVGEQRKVEMATAYITQMDARRRQVAVNVKVIDINLLNEDVFNSSFSFGVNDSFFVQDNGAATLRFGESSPARGIDINTPTGRISSTPVIPNPYVDSNTFIDLDSSFVIPGTGAGVVDGNTGGIISPRTGRQFFNRDAGISNDPTRAGLTDFELAEDGITLNEDGTLSFEAGTDGTAISALPSFFKYPKKFLALLEARITSGNAKILTDPTLVVQEGETAVVRLTQEVVTSVNTEIDGESGVRTITPVIGEAGLQLGIEIEQIDDNGFVSLLVFPEISSIGSTQEFDSGDGAVNLLNLLSTRFVTSGLIRVRDGQTLILSGIIQDQERVAVTKVPILGDIPLLGSLFRSTNKTNERAEVIVLLTPEVIDEQADFGYNYQPSKDAREMLREGGLDLPNNPEQ